MACRTYGYYKYKLVRDGSARIHQYTGCRGTEIVIPTEMEGHPVTAIAGNAFAGHGELESVTLPGTILYVEGGAFRDCSRLRRVVNLEYAKYIGKRAFAGCRSLVDYRLPADFNACSKLHILYAGQFKLGIQADSISLRQYTGTDTEIVLPEWLTELGPHAFAYCRSLKRITIPDSVTAIGEAAFEDCTALTEVALPKGLTNLGMRAFKGCRSLSSITIPDSVTAIGEAAFEDCTALTEVALPKGLTNLGMRAFKGCRSLSSITIPDSVAAIGKAAFEGCTALTEVVLPQGLTTLGEGAFGCCSALNSIDLPDQLEKIPNYTFSCCYGLQSVRFPAALTEIGEAAFKRCKALRSVVLPDGLKTLESFAFQYCSQLEEVALPGTLTYVGFDVFDAIYEQIPAIQRCGGYSYLVRADGAAVILWYDGNDEELYVPEALDGHPVVIIGGGAFRSAKGKEEREFRKVVLPDSVISIGQAAFSTCNRMAELSLPKKLRCIGRNAFVNCLMLRSVTIPGEQLTIQQNAFLNCWRLEHVILEAELLSVSKKAFADCSALEKIDVLSPSSSFTGEMLMPEIWDNVRWIHGYFRQKAENEQQNDHT